MTEQDDNLYDANAATENSLAASPPETTPPTMAEPVLKSIPRIWPAIVVPIIAIVASVIVGSVVLVGGIFALGIELDPTNMNAVLAKVIEHPIGIWLLILPGQLTFLAAAIAAATLSPVPTGRRLRLGKGRLPIWSWFVFLVATPCVGMTTSLVIEAIGFEPSEQIKMLEDLLTARSGLGFVISIILVAVVPGFVEEALFRGYLQSRLVQRWSAWAAILFSAFIFAIAHGDPLHACAVFPLGVWLGFIAFRCQSIWPPILCHFGNNLLALVLTQLGVESLELGVVEIGIMIPCVVAMLWSLLLLFLKFNYSKPEID